MHLYEDPIVRRNFLHIDDSDEVKRKKNALGEARERRGRRLLVPPPTIVVLSHANITNKKPHQHVDTASAVADI